jgi:hypothetical protein
MIRTATGIILLILIAIYGILFLYREPFTSTINFVNVIDAVQKMTLEEKQVIMESGKKILEQLGAQMVVRLSSAPINNNEAAEIITTINNSINAEFKTIIQKYKLSTVDIISLLLYAISAYTKQNKDDPNITPITRQNMEILANYVKTWNPEALASTVSNPQSSSGSILATPSIASKPQSSSGSILAIPSIASKPQSSSGSLFSGTTSSPINQTVREAIRDELRAAGLFNKVNETPRQTTVAAPGAPNYAYDGGVTQQWQQNAACNARDWCCRCRKPKHNCGCY